MITFWSALKLLHWNSYKNNQRKGLILFLRNMYGDDNIMADWECSLDLKGLFYTRIILTSPPLAYLKHLQDQVQTPHFT